MHLLTLPGLVFVLVVTILSLSSSVIAFRQISAGSASRQLSNRFSQTSSLKMSSARDLTQNAISTHKIMVFSKTYCPYCTRAKDAISNLGQKYEVIELDVSNLIEMSSRMRIP